MKPHQFANDPEWKNLQGKLAAAEAAVVEKTELAIQHHYRSPHFEELKAAEERLDTLQAAIANREATISHSGWGLFG